MALQQLSQRPAPFFTDSLAKQQSPSIVLVNLSALKRARHSLTQPLQFSFPDPYYTDRTMLLRINLFGSPRVSEQDIVEIFNRFGETFR
jgi:hypothetical protein